MNKLHSIATQSRCALTLQRGRDHAIKYPPSGFLIFFLFLIGFFLAGNQVQAAPKAGDILVIDQIGPRQEVGALFLVKRKTGRRILLSDFGNPAQGPLGSAPASVAVGPSGQIYVSDLFAGEPSGGALFEIDPDTGNRTLVSNFGAGDPQGVLSYGLAVQSDGQILSNASRGDGVPGLVVRVRPDTDERTVVTDLADPVQGETEPDRFIIGLALERSRRILIGTARGSGQVDSAIFRVNPVSGRRRLLSDFANPAQGTDVADLFFSTGLAVERSGQILAASNFLDLLLLRVHPRTGQRTVVSNFSDPAQGPTVDGFLVDVAVKRFGTIIVASGDTLFKVRPRSGRRTVFSDSDDAGQGPPFVGITSVAVVPRR